jgi:hypothetical protein
MLALCLQRWMKASVLHPGSGSAYGTGNRPTVAKIKRALVPRSGRRSRLSILCSACIGGLEEELSVKCARCVGADDVPSEVHVQRHRGVGVAELVSDLTGGEAGFVEPGCDRLAEGVGGDPGPRALVAAQALITVAENEFARSVELLAGTAAPLALERIEQLAQVTGEVVRIAKATAHRGREDRPRADGSAAHELGCEAGSAITRQQAAVLGRG